MSSRRWKRHELEISKILGGVRLPNNGYGQPDVVAGNLAVQVKTRKSLPTWLTEAVDQSILDATNHGPDMLPVVVLSHGVQGKKSRRLVVMDLDHLLTLFPDE